MPNFFNKHVALCLLLPLLLSKCGEKNTSEENKTLAFKQERDTSVHTTPLVLWYLQPASQSDTVPYHVGVSTNVHGDGEGKGWDEALPIGNGKLAAMIFGGIKRERIQLNEESLYSGKYVENTNGESAQEIQDIRKLIFEGKNEEAQIFAEQKLTGNPENAATYQPLADLFIEYTDIEDPASATDYYRDLHIDSAISTVHYRIGPKLYSREVFASYPDNVIVIKLSTDQPGGINCRINLMREKEAETFRSPFDTTLLIQRGTVPSNGLQFETQVKAVYKGGTVRNGTKQLVAQQVDELILYISAATSLKTPNHALQAKQTLLSAIEKPYESLRADHIQSYKHLFGRLELNLNFKDRAYDLPTDARIAKVRSGTEDKYLTELVFQYGRYLLICSSRPDYVPANMQGLWNEHMAPVYGSGFRTSWTLPLVYSHAEATNLSEMTEPIISLIDTCALFGTKASKSLYGTGGWVAHDYVSIYGDNLPTSHAVEAVSPLGGAWLCNILFENYQYSGDEVFLKQRAYPLMKGASTFLMDYLTEVPTGLPLQGSLVVAPSIANGNAFNKSDGSKVKVGYASTIDQLLTRDLLQNTLKAIEALSSPTYKFDPQFRSKLEQCLAKLPMMNPKDSIIPEWLPEFASSTDERTYISQLYGLYPSNQFSKTSSPELYMAARKTLLKNISYIKKSAVSHTLAAIWWARLGEATLADDQLLSHIQNSLTINLLASNPPFSIDGNMAFTTAVTEMLLQSHEDCIHFVPALPSSWENGSVNGVRARGGFICDFEWGKGKVYAIIVSTSGKPCKIMSSSPIKVFSNGNVIDVKREGKDIFSFATSQGQSYSLTYTDTRQGDQSSNIGIWPDLKLGIDLGIKF